MFSGALRDVGRALALSWWRMLVVQLLFSVVLAAAVAIAGRVVASIIPGLSAWASADPESIGDRVAAIGMMTGAGIGLLSLPIALIAVAAIMGLADSALVPQKTSLLREIGRATRLAPRALLGALVAVAASVIVFVLAVFISVVGLVGLGVVAVTDLVRRSQGREGSAPWRAWLVLAVPFGALWWVLPAALMSLVAAVLEPAWPVPAMRAGVNAARRRRWLILGVWLAAVVVAILVAVGPASIAGLWSDPLSLVLGAVLPLVATVLPVTAAVALYRRAAGPTGRQRPSTREAAAETVSASIPFSPVMARLATALVVAVVLPLGAVATGSAATAQATAADAVSITVNSSADTTDATALAAQTSACATGVGECTLRGAFSVAQSAAAGGAAGATITVSSGQTITVVAPLTFAPDTVSTGRATGGGEDAPPTQESPTDPTPTETPGVSTPTPTQNSSDAPSETPTETPRESAGADDHPTSAPAASETPSPSSDEKPTGMAPSSVEGKAASLSAVPWKVAAAGEQMPEEQSGAREETGSGETGGGGSGSAPSKITSGVLHIVGGGSVVDGGGVTQLVDVRSEYWSLTVSDLTLRNGASSTYSGALLAGVPHTTLTRVVAQGNTSVMGAGAVFARSLDVSASSFLQNSVTYGSESSLGGAIRTTGTTTIVNSTFGDNGIQNLFDAHRNQGGDVWADAGMMVVNSTFVNYAAGSLGSGQGATTTVRNSVFSTQVNGALTCGGSVAGGNNLSVQGDTSCPGAAGQSLAGGFFGTVDTAAALPVYRLPMGNYNPAIGAGANCPSTDQLGGARPTQGCDLGAVQTDGATAVTVTATPDRDVSGTVTFRAMPSLVSGGVAQGSVTFTVGGTSYGPVSLTEASTPNGVSDTAVVVVPGLRGGQRYDYSAAFTGTSPYRDSVSPTRSITIDRQTVPVTLTCGATAPTCAGTTWNLASGQRLTAHVTVGDAPAGSVVIAGDPSGWTVLAGPVTVADGTASLPLSADTIGAGTFTLYAIYTSDDGTTTGTATPAPVLTVRAAAMVSLSFPAATGVAGDPQTGVATVSVTGAGAVPTGRVSVSGASAVLDAQGHATVRLGSGAWGATRFVATYEGDDTYSPSSSAAVAFRLTEAPTSARFTTTPAVAALGSPFSAVVLVTLPEGNDQVPSGALRIFADGRELTDAAVQSEGSHDTHATTFTVTVPGSALTAGTHRLTASFEAGQGFTDSQAAEAVVDVRITGTTTTLTSSATSASYSDSVSFTASVSAPGDSRTPTGSIEFSRDGDVLGTVALAACPAPAGCATATFSASAGSLVVGGGQVTARYLGSDVFSESTSSALALSVTRAKPTVSVSGPAASVFGSTPTFGISIAAGTSSPPSGAVSVRLVGSDGTTVSTAVVPLAAGTASAAFASSPTPDRYTVVVDFGGDGQFEAASGQASLQVTASSTVTTLDDGWSVWVPYGGATRVGVTVATDGGAFPEGDVVLSYNGTDVGRATLSAANDTSRPGFRQIAVTATFGANLTSIPDAATARLTARFEAQQGFVDSYGSPTTGNPSGSKTVNITPLSTSLSLSTPTGALGGVLDATATVSILGAPAGLQPSGFVTFTASRPDGTMTSPVRVTLQNGVARLTGAGDRITLSASGHWHVTAVYTSPADEQRYKSAAEGDLTGGNLTVGQGTAGIDVTSTFSRGSTHTLQVTAVLTGDVPPTGTVTLQSADGCTAVSSGPVEVTKGWGAQGAQFGASLHVDFPDRSDLVNRDCAFVVTYSGNGAYSSAESERITVAFPPRNTDITLKRSGVHAFDAPVFLGSVAAYDIHVDTGDYPISGNVDLTRNGVTIAQGVPDSKGDLHIERTATVEGPGALVATFRPDTDAYRSSRAELKDEWVAAPVVVTVDGGTPVATGYSAVSVTVRYAAERYPGLVGADLPREAPQGAVSITGTGGESCVAYLTPVGASSPLASTGTCYVPYTSGGQRTLTASFPARYGYAGGTGETVLQVGQGTPSAALTVGSTSSTSWNGSTSVPVQWSVSGPSTGSIEIRLAGVVVCAASVLTGSCSVPLPAFQQTSDDALITLTYVGSDAWRPITVSRQGQIVACVPFAGSSFDPAGAGTLSLYPAPNCGQGTGYYDGTSISVGVAMNEGYVFDAISVNGAVRPDVIPGSQFDVAARIEGSTIVPLSVAVSTRRQCVQVSARADDIDASGIDPAAKMPVSALRISSDGMCGLPRQMEDGTLQAKVVIGSQVSVTVDRTKIAAHRQFVGWSGAGTSIGDTGRSNSFTFTARGDFPRIVAWGGAVCYAPPVLQQSAGGTLSFAESPNCTDPVTGVQGYGWGALLTGKRVSDGPGTRHFFMGWSGDTDRYVTGDPRSGASTFLARVGDRYTISATYGTCVALTTQVISDRMEGSPGVDVQTPGNCPLGGWSQSAPWYISGTQVTLSADPRKTELSFFGWQGLGIDQRETTHSTVTTVLTTDTTATAAFGITRRCMPYTISSQPAGALTFSDVGWGNGPNACDVAFSGVVNKKYYDQGESGNELGVSATPVPAAAGAQVVWLTTTGRTAADAEKVGTDERSNLWTKGSYVNTPVYGSTSVVAYACEFAQFTTLIYSTSGEIVQSAISTNTTAGNGVDNFLQLPRADCSVGADPKRGGGYAWQVGTDVTPQVVADPRAYKFLGWGMDATGTGTTPDRSIVLVGPGRTAEGDEFHKRVSARFQAICYTLNLPSDRAKLQVQTAPNCPGVAYPGDGASSYSYLGGTNVVVTASDGDGSLFREWTSGHDAADGRYAVVTMTSDKSLIPYYSSPSAGETFEKIGNQVADGLSIGAKASLGFASATFSAYVRAQIAIVSGVSMVMSYASDGLNAIGAEGAFADGLKTTSRVIDGVIDLIMAPMDCITAYSAGGNGVLLVAQNAVGTALALRATYSAGTVTDFKSVNVFTKMINAAETVANKAQPVITAVSTGAKVVSAAQTLKQVLDEGKTTTDTSSSAADMWGSRESFSVFSDCMKATSAKSLDALDAGARMVKAK